MAAPSSSLLYENSLRSTVEGRVQVSVPGLYFVGNRDVPTLIDSTPRKTGLIEVELAPHGAFPFFGVPMPETVNRHLDSELAFRRWGRDTWEAVRNLKQVGQKLSFIEGQLLNLLHKNRRDSSLIDFCVRTLELCHGRMSVKELERQTGYTRRYLDLLFSSASVFVRRYWPGSFAFRNSIGNGQKACHSKL